MQILILPLKIISIPLIIIIGESNIDEKTKTIALLILAFVYNNLLGFASWFLIILISASISIFSMIIIGFIFLIYLITINVYIKRKLDINITIYIILNITAFLTGILLI